MTWCFKRENFLSGVCKAKGRDCMEWAAAQDKPILEIDFDEVGVLEAQEISKSLY